MFIKRSGVLFDEAAAPDTGSGATGGGAAATPATGATGATGTAATSADTPPENPEEKAGWLKGRLEQAKSSGQKELLKSLGVEKTEDIKAALDRLKTIDAEKLSAEERAAAEIAELKPKAAKSAALEGIVKGHADKAFGALTEEQQAAVTRLAGDDPAKMLEAIDVLGPTWATKAAIGATGATETKGASTTSAGKQPNAIGTTSAEDPKATYARLKAENPVAAAEYRFANLKALSSG